MDIDLGPGIDGTEAARRILERRHVPIVFLSSHAERSYVEKVRGLTRYGYIVKDSGDFVLQSSIEMAFELFGAHERLRQSEGLLSTVLRNIPDLVWLKDAGGMYLACNPSFERFFGATEAEIVGHTDYDFTEATQADFFRDNDRLAIERGGPTRNEEWLTFASDGHRALHETIKTPMFDASGRLVGVLGIARDITARKRTEDRLKESEEAVQRKLKALTEPAGDLSELGIRDAVDIATIQTLMEDVSAATGMVTAILDTEGRVLVATGWQGICTHFHRACAASSANCTESDLFLARTLAEGECVEYRCKNGLWDVVTPLYVEGRHVGNIYTGQFFYDTDTVDEAAFVDQAACYGYPEAPYLEALRRVPRRDRQTVRAFMNFLVHITHFISRLSYANLRLARAMGDLRRSEEEKALLYEELQHRVKNSLAIVSSILRLNMGELTDAAPRRTFQEAADRVRCVSMIYEQLSASARAGSVRLDAYLAGLVALLRTTYAPKVEEVRLETDLAEVECPQKQAISLGLIFNELFTNALKYACRGGRTTTVSVRLSRLDARAELVISDDGPGLPPDFDPNATKSFGLRIVHLLAGDLGAELEFTRGSGTAVALRFPLGAALQRPTGRP